MTEQEGDLLFDIGEEYWQEFSKLIAEKLKKAPVHLREELKMMLQDKSSVYGSCYEEYL